MTSTTDGLCVTCGAPAHDGSCNGRWPQEATGWLPQGYTGSRAMHPTPPDTEALAKRDIREQRRYGLAKDFAVAIMRRGEPGTAGVVAEAVSLADALLDELERKPEEEHEA